MVRIYGSQEYGSCGSHWKHKWKGHLVQVSSYICQKKTSIDGDTLDPQYSMMEYSLKGSQFMRGTMFHQEFQTCGIHGMMVWWYKSESDKGIEALSIKEVVAGSLDDPNEKWGMDAYILYCGSHVIWLQILWTNALS